jgi:dihydrolipoamide dehydrogenase
MKSPLVILGGGPGGYAAAFLAADLGMQVALVDMEARLGGVCLLRGCIPSKALLHVAKSMAEARHLADWGVKFAPPEIDIAAMRARKEKVIATLTGGLKQLAAKRKVQVIRARATFENSQTLRLHAVDGKPPEDDRLEFEHCILATGSSPTQLPGLLKMAAEKGTRTVAATSHGSAGSRLATEPVPFSARIMDSTGALELPDVPESLLVVGGGYIGLEMGTVYAALGSRVSVVELTDGLLPGADRDLVKPLHKKLEKDFAAICLGTKVVALKDAADAVEVTFEGNVEQKTQRFGRVLLSVGRRPNSANLGLENTKVQVDAKGFVTVDNRQRTADPRILAIGDVAGEPMLAHKAAHEGKVAVESLHGEPAVFEPRAIPAVVFTDPEIAWAGLTETQAKQQGRKVEVAQFPWAASGRAQAVGRTEGLTKWLIDPESGRVVGCGIVGFGAGDLIAEAVLAIEMGAAPRDVTDSIHPHPTFSETLAFAAEVFFGTATDLYRPKRG